MRFAQQYNGIQTMLGRWRWSGIRGFIHSESKWDVAAASRKCMNTPIQGSATEIVKLAMLNTHQNLCVRGRFDMLVNVHDELGFEVDSTYCDPLEAAHRVKALMELKEGTYSIPAGFDIPIDSTPAIGLSWGRMFEADKLVKEYRKARPSCEHCFEAVFGKCKPIGEPERAACMKYQGVPV